MNIFFSDFYFKLESHSYILATVTQLWIVFPCTVSQPVPQFLCINVTHWAVPSLLFSCSLSRWTWISNKRWRKNLKRKMRKIWLIRNPRKTTKAAYCAMRSIDMTCWGNGTHLVICELNISFVAYYITQLHFFTSLIVCLHMLIHIQELSQN